MNKIKAAIIEDEIPAARLLRDTLLSLRPDWEVQLLPGNIEEAVGSGSIFIRISCFWIFS